MSFINYIGGTFMAIQFRVNRTRMGFVKDSSCNFAMRSYFFKTEKMNNSGDTVLYTDFAPYICCMFTGLNLVVNQQVEVDDIRRIQVFMNSEDPYFSIVMGFKLNTIVKNDIENSTLRFYISAAAFVFKIFHIYTNAYDTHLHTGAWDIAHCADEFIFEFRLKEAVTTLNTCLRECRDTSIAAINMFNTRPNEDENVDENVSVNVDENVGVNVDENVTEEIPLRQKRRNRTNDTRSTTADEGGSNL